MENRSAVPETLPVLPAHTPPYNITQYVNSNVNNAPQQACKISKGSALMNTNSNQAGNANHTRINPALGESSAEGVRKLPPHAPNILKKTEDCDSGGGGDKMGNSVPPMDQQRQSGLNTKPDESQEMLLQGLKQFLYQYSKQTKQTSNSCDEFENIFQPLPPNQTVQPMASKLRKRCGETLNMSDEPSSSKHRKFWQGGVSVGTVSSTSNHTTVPPHNVNQGVLSSVETDYQRFNLGIGALEVQNGDQTSEYVAGLGSPDEKWQETCKRSPNTTGKISSSCFRKAMEPHNIPDDYQKLLEALDLSQELHRLATFARWPQDNTLKNSLAQSGFYYLGCLGTDLTRCFFCGGVLKNWHSDDSVEDRHRGLGLNCLKAREYDNNSRARSDMTKWGDRIATFNDPWPWPEIAGKVAVAGFWYSGIGDNVVCCCCGGGLDRWKEDDDPWFRHAQYFPDCQFLKSEGPEYVKSRNPHVQKITPRVVQPGRMPSCQSLHSDSTTSANGGERFQPDENAQFKAQTPDKKLAYFMMQHQGIVQKITNLGFSSKLIRAVFKDKLVAGAFNPDSPIDSIESLMYDVLQKHGEWRQREADLERQLKLLRDDRTGTAGRDSFMRHCSGNS